MSTLLSEINQRLSGVSIVTSSCPSCSSNSSPGSYDHSIVDVREDMEDGNARLELRLTVKPPNSTSTAASRCVRNGRANVTSHVTLCRLRSICLAARHKLFHAGPASRLRGFRHWRRGHPRYARSGCGNFVFVRRATHFGSAPTWRPILTSAKIRSPSSSATPHRAGLHVIFTDFFLGSGIGGPGPG